MRSRLPCSGESSSARGAEGGVSTGDDASHECGRDGEGGRVEAEAAAGAGFHGEEAASRRAAMASTALAMLPGAAGGGDCGVGS